MSQSVLITGGAGYIGSHTCVALARAGYRSAILDTFANAAPDAAERIAQSAGVDIPVHRIDIRDGAALQDLFARDEFGAVIHCAALKSIAESRRDPERYADININGSETLIRTAHAAGVRHLLFSSSASVYGTPESVPVTESHPTRAENPYGFSKLAIERMLAGHASGDPGWRSGVFRYFNAAGALETGEIGEAPRTAANNLFPHVARAARDPEAHVTIHGGDFPTRDGTGERDYVHVMDIAAAHIAALRHFEAGGDSFTVNLGTGQPHSVREVVDTFARVSGRTIASVIAPRRDGDVAVSFADPAKAEALLGWRAERSLEDICRDAWAWERRRAGADGSAA